MTREDTIIELKWALQLENKVTTPCIMTAIKSLEAWDKVIEEIENINDTVHEGTNHFYKTAEDIKTEVIDIINGHLREVEE